MNSLRTSGRRVAPGVLATLALVAAVAAACSSAGAGNPSPSPSAPSSPAPSGQPSASPGEPGAVIVDLDVATDHDVSVVIDDGTGSIVKAGSGRGGDGMSVKWFEAEVVNVDDDTIRVTWVGLPRDEQLELVVSGDQDGLVLAFEQAAPPANSDATGHDRVLVLDFDGPVSADDVEVTFSEAGA